MLELQKEVKKDREIGNSEQKLLVLAHKREPLDE